MLFLSSCEQQKLDEYGGFYNEKTGRYKYVRPIKMPATHAPMGLQQPREGKPQQIWGKVVGFSEDLKSFWIHIDNRQSYQMLAEHVTRFNRNDKQMYLRIHLKYINPLGSLPTPELRRQWKPFAEEQMRELFSGDKVIVTTFYKKIPKIFEGECFKIIQTQKGERMRNLNQWMIFQGLSVYFYAKDEKEPRKDYLKAQSLAKKRRAGVWNYL